MLSQRINGCRAVLPNERVPTAILPIGRLELVLPTTGHFFQLKVLLSGVLPTGVLPTGILPTLIVIIVILLRSFHELFALPTCYFNT